MVLSLLKSVTVQRFKNKIDGFLQSKQNVIEPINTFIKVFVIST